MIHELERALKPWGTCRPLRRLEGGFRNEVHLVERAGELVVTKTTRRSAAALAWLEPVQALAREAGFVVPSFIRSERGRMLENGCTLETFVKGRAVTAAEARQALPLIVRFHALSANWAQRPGFAAAEDLLHGERGGDADLSTMPPDLVERCREAWRPLVGRPRAAVHGDLNPANLLKTPQGLALVDWDEARADAPAFDTFTLNREEVPPELKAALVAWEVAVSWQLEPEHAQAQAELLFGTWC